MSVVLESDLLHLVDVGILPSKELCSWRICRGVNVPTEDTHESVVYVPFLVRGFALPISPFFHGLFDFYNMNLTHLNPNSILQISIFVVTPRILQLNFFSFLYSPNSGVTFSFSFCPR
jgi:hypothetical protein